MFSVLILPVHIQYVYMISCFQYSYFQCIFSMLKGPHGFNVNTSRYFQCKSCLYIWNQNLVITVFRCPSICQCQAINRHNEDYKNKTCFLKKFWCSSHWIPMITNMVLMIKKRYSKWLMRFHSSYVNLMATGRYGSNFKSIIFKLIIQNSSLWNCFQMNATEPINLLKQGLCSDLWLKQRFYKHE